jgi:hypothetical protein
VRRLLGVAGALLSVGLATGCGDPHDWVDREPPPLEVSKVQTREELRQFAAEAVREQLGVLPPPQSESHSRCDGAPWIDDDRAYFMNAVWNLPLAPEDHEPTLRALQWSSGRFEARVEVLDDGRFSLAGRDGQRRLGYSVTSNEPPTTVRLSVGSWCRIDPG